MLNEIESKNIVYF